MATVIVAPSGYRKGRITAYRAAHSHVRVNGSGAWYQVSPGAHAVLVCDSAGWHQRGKQLRVPDNIDAKHKLIVEQQVTNQVVDMGLLTATAEPAKEILGIGTVDVVADKGYFKIEDIEACEKAGMTPYVPRPQRGPSVREGRFRKDEFEYDAETDSMICPAGQRLQPYSSSLMRGLKKINYANRAPAETAPCGLDARATNFARCRG